MTLTKLIKLSLHSSLFFFFFFLPTLFHDVTHTARRPCRPECLTRRLVCLHMTAPIHPDTFTEREFLVSPPHRVSILHHWSLSRVAIHRQTLPKAPPSPCCARSVKTFEKSLLFFSLVNFSRSIRFVSNPSIEKINTLRDYFYD